MRIAHPQIGKPVSATRVRGSEHAAEPVLDDGAQRPSGVPGVTLGPRQKLVMDVDRRLHEPMLPIVSDMGKQYVLLAATEGIPSLYISRTAAKSDALAPTTRTIAIRCAPDSETFASPCAALCGFDDELEHS